MNEADYDFFVDSIYDCHEYAESRDLTAYEEAYEEAMLNQATIADNHSSNW